MDNINNCHTLFLDRDGVLNERIIDNYVTSTKDFVIMPGVLEAMSIFAKYFDHIFIVTNQQGIGKGLMTESDLEHIHNAFIQEVKQAGGRIDKIYHCSALKDQHSFMRKPSIGMALQARKDFGDVVLRDSIMIGDTKSDMLFGRRAKMKTVLVGDEKQVVLNYPHLIDYYYPTLLDFARQLPNLCENSKSK